MKRIVELLQFTKFRQTNVMKVENTDWDPRDLLLLRLFNKKPNKVETTLNRL